MSSNYVIVMNMLYLNYFHVYVKISIIEKELIDSYAFKNCKYLRHICNNISLK